MEVLSESPNILGMKRQTTIKSSDFPEILSDKEMKKMKDILTKDTNLRSTEDCNFIGIKFKDLGIFEALKISRTEELIMRKFYQ